MVGTGEGKACATRAWSSRHGLDQVDGYSANYSVSCPLGLGGGGPEEGLTVHATGPFLLAHQVKGPIANYSM
jgi:hypothetical protein